MAGALINITVCFAVCVHCLCLLLVPTCQLCRSHFRWPTSTSCPPRQPRRMPPHIIVHVSIPPLRSASAARRHVLSIITARKCCQFELLPRTLSRSIHSVYKSVCILHLIYLFVETCVPNRIAHKLTHIMNICSARYSLFRTANDFTLLFQSPVFQLCIEKCSYHI